MWLAVGMLAAMGLMMAYLVKRQQTRRVPDDRLDMWLAFLKRPTSKATKGFRKTTARLSDAEYGEIKRQLFTPTLLAEWEERQTQVDNEFAIRAIQLEKVFRRQAEGKPLSSEEDAILIREGVRTEGKGLSDEN